MISSYYQNWNRNLSHVPVSAFYRNRNWKSNRSRIGQCEQAVKQQSNKLYYIFANNIFYLLVVNVQQTNITFFSKIVTTWFF